MNCEWKLLVSYGVTQSEVTWDDLMWFMSRIRRALDSDFENKNPVTHFYDLKCMTHEYLFMVHMTFLSSWWPFSWWPWKSEGSVTLTFELRAIRTKTEYMKMKTFEDEDWLKTDVEYESYRVLILALNSNRPIKIVSKSRSFGLILGLYFATPSKIDGFTRFQTF